MYCVVLTARTAALSFFQNPAHDRDSNLHLIFYPSETTDWTREYMVHSIWYHHTCR